MNFSHVAIAAAGLAMVVPVTQASAQQFNGNTIVTSISQPDLVAIVNERGDRIVSQKEFGDVSVVAADENDKRYLLQGTACERPGVQGCLGLSMEVRYDAAEVIPLDKINRANLAYAAAKVSLGVNEQDVPTLRITHYVILDGGQKMENLAVILVNLLAMAPGIEEMIWP